MIPQNSYYSSIVKLCFFILILPCILTFPVQNKTYYETSIRNLRLKNCVMPSTVKLPFEISDPNIKTFDFLSAPLKECQTADAIQEDNEAHFLCKEIFEVLQNITCTIYNTSLPEIKSNRISKDVCEEFESMKDVLPKQNEYLSVKLTDKFVCKLLCGQKFKLLCQTLLWTYDIQEKIGNFLDNNPVEVKNADVDADENVQEDNKDPENEPEQEPLLDGKTNKNEDHILDDGTDYQKNLDKKVVNDITNNNIDKPLESKHLDPSSTMSSNNETTSQISLITTAISDNKEKKNLPINLNGAENQELLVHQQNNSVPGGKVQLIESDNNENHNPEHNKIPDVSKPNHENPSHKDNIKETSKVLTSEPVTTTKTVIPKSEDVSETAKNAAISNMSIKKNETESVSADLKPTEKNEVNNMNFKEEREPESQENIAKPVIPNKNKITETPKADVNQINLETELTTVQMSPDEEPEDRDEDQFFNNDTENEGDYEKSEFEETGDFAKKPTAIKNIKNEKTNAQDLSKYDDMLLDRNNFGRGQEEIINVFPEQEDGHFFFYLLSIVLILMAGYLIFHNKQKILALIVEGRHERRRRSHGSGYKKLETK